MVAVVSPDKDQVSSVSALEKQKNSTGNSSEIHNNTSIDELKQREKVTSGRDQYPTPRSFWSMPKLKSKKWIIIGGFAGGGGGIIVLASIALVVFLAGYLKIPGLADNITRYQSVAFSRQFRAAMNRSVSEASSLATASPETYNNYKTIFEDKPSSTTLGTLFKRLNNWRPNQAIKNLGQSGQLKFTVEDRPFGGQVLKSVTLGDVTYTVEPVTGIQRFIPGFKAYNRAQLWQEVEPKIADRIDGGPLNFFRTADGMRKVRCLFGGGCGWFSGWDLLKFKNATTDTSAIAEDAAQTATSANEAATIPSNTATEAISSAEAEVVTEETNLLNSYNTASDANSKQAAEMAILKAVNNDGLSPDIANTIKNRLSDNFGTQALKFADPLLEIYIGLCIVYDGSVQQSGPPINNNSASVMSQYYDIQSRADQIKYGTKGGANPTELNRAISAKSTSLGPTENSNASRRAYGYTVNTLTDGGPEFGSGEANYYDVLDALNITKDSPQGKLTRVLLNHNVCSTLTDTKVAIGISLANIAAGVMSAGEIPAAEGATQLTLREAIQQYSQRIVAQVFAKTTKKVIVNGVEKTIESGLASRLKNFLVRQGVVLVGLSGATLGAHILVGVRSGLLYNGLQGAAEADLADAGGNMVFNQAEQTQIGGRVLSHDEIAARDAVNGKQLAFEDSQKSVGERYFALSNPRSLLSATIMTTASAIRPSFFTDIAVRLGDVISQPFGVLGSFTRIFGIAHATPDPNTQHYGNVQFGWSEEEARLIDSSDSYLSLQNQSILDQSGQEDAIAQKYAACFGYKYNADGSTYDFSDTNSKLQLDVVGDGSIGTLLSSGKIPRDEQGNVLNDNNIDHCTPDNLGAHNTQFGDLVLRFRLAMQYSTATSQLIDAQTVTQ